MPSRRLLGVLAAALGALAVVAYWARRAPPGDAHGADAPGAAAEHAEATSPETALAPELATAPSTAPAREVAAAIESSLPPVTPLAAPQGGLLVRVVGADGTPRADVPVALFAELDVGPPVARALSRAPDGLAAFDTERVRRKVPPDARFSVAISLPIEPRVERALEGWKPGATWSGGTLELVLPSGAEVWLAPLRVEVVDADGKPAPDVEVELVGRPRKTPSSQQLGQARTRAPDGIAELRRERWFEWSEFARAMQMEFDVEARCRGPFLEPPSATVDPASPEPTRLQLPLVGAVVVRVADHEGRAPATAASVRLEWYEPGASEPLGKVERAATDGISHVERVGLGLDLALTARLEDGGATAPTLRRPGPTRAGERVEVELAFAAPLPRLVGRFVDAHGAPAASMLFWLAGRPLAADADGRFSVPWSEAPAPLLFEERSDPNLGAPPDWMPRYADVPFPPPAGDGRFDAGDVVLLDVPIVVAGRVVDETGAPVRQAWIAIAVEYDEAKGGTWMWRGLKITGVPPLATRADGTFEARSLTSSRTVRVSASSRDHLESEPVVVPPGTRALQLVVVRGEDRANTRGRVAGSLRIEGDVPWFWVVVALDGGEDAERATIPLGGRFLLSDVLPGTHRVEARTEGTRWPIAAVDGLVVTAGATTSDPRLDPLDLTGRTRTWRARILDASGKPLARRSVRLAALGEDGTARLGDDGLLAFLAPLEVVSVRLTLDGHAPVELTWSSTEQRVQLAD